MSDDVLIRVDGVSKKFCRDLKRSLWYGVQDTVSDILGHDGSAQPLRPDEFWAVDDVSFELRRGECLGLIGRNGAGKTTLLKMLNGLIKPDRGRIEMRGRVGALIALGAGFNPILSGRENVYVNGAVLGLNRKEIDAKFDEILDFAEIGEFIDAPVQSYSSGMQVRLGFAVATAIDPDVLLLDEVLAVGDAIFQAKCYRRVESLLERAAVILVSHYPYHIQKVCDTTLLLAQGKIQLSGPPNHTLLKYSALAGEEIRPTITVLGEGIADANLKRITSKVKYGGKLQLILQIETSSAVFCDQAYLNIADSADQVHAQVILSGLVGPLREGKNLLDISVGPLFLSDGKYHGSIILWTSGGKKTLAEIRNCIRFENSGPVRLGIACYYPPNKSAFLNTTRADVGATQEKQADDDILESPSPRP